jgi:DNA-directed RNA polymerase III subunit RPC3
VGDLADAYELSPGSKDSVAAAGHAAANGIASGVDPASANKPSFNQHIATVSELHNTLRTLLKAGILAKVGLRTYIPPADLQEQIEEAVIVDQFPDGKVTGPKKQAEFKTAVNTLKRKWRAEDAYSDHQDLSSKGVMKRPGDYFNNNNKRPKVNGDLPNGHHDDGAKLSVLCCVFPPHPTCRC